MGQIVLIRNPLNSSEKEVFEYEGAVIDWLQSYAPTGFGSPIELWLNGEQIDVDDADVELVSDDICAVIVMPSGLDPISLVVVQIVVSMAVSFVIGRIFGPKAPTVPGFADQPEPNTVYSVAAKQNAARLGEAIPVIYGNPRTIPDYISQPYTSYDHVSVAPQDVSRRIAICDSQGNPIQYAHSIGPTTVELILKIEIGNNQPT